MRGECQKELLAMDNEMHKTTVIQRAKSRLSYADNADMSSADVASILSEYYYSGVSIIRKWRKLKDNSEIILGTWDEELVAFIVDSWNAMNEETLASTNVGGNSRSYKFTPEGALKSKIRQVLF